MVVNTGALRCQSNDSNCIVRGKTQGKFFSFKLLKIQYSFSDHQKISPNVPVQTGQFHACYEPQKLIIERLKIVQICVFALENLERHELKSHAISVTEEIHNKLE